jgi:hypothetical protein
MQRLTNSPGLGDRSAGALSQRTAEQPERSMPPNSTRSEAPHALPSKRSAPTRTKTALHSLIETICVDACDREFRFARPKNPWPDERANAPSPDDERAHLALRSVAPLLIYRAG